MNPATREVTRGRPAGRADPHRVHAAGDSSCAHPRQVLTREQILKSVWGFDFEPSSNSLDVYVMYLRRKTEAGGLPRLIHTVRGVGYVLRVRRGQAVTERPPSRCAAALAVPGPAAALPAGRAGRGGRRGGGRRGGGRGLVHHPRPAHRRAGRPPCSSYTQGRRRHAWPGRSTPAASPDSQSLDDQARDFADVQMPVRPGGNALGVGRWSSATRYASSPADGPGGQRRRGPAPTHDATTAKGQAVRVYTYLQHDQRAATAAPT